MTSVPPRRRQPPTDRRPSRATPGSLREQQYDNPAHDRPGLVDPALVPRGVTRGHAAAAVRLLSSRLAEPWTLTSLAEEIHLSRSQLVRAFDATVGLSPMAYLRWMRVQEMARLLDSTDLSIAAAARAVGWADANYASRCFHSHYDMPPSEFRHRHALPPCIDPG